MNICILRIGVLHVCVYHTHPLLEFIPEMVEVRPQLNRTSFPLQNIINTIKEQNIKKIDKQTDFGSNIPLKNQY